MKQTSLFSCGVVLAALLPITALASHLRRGPTAGHSHSTHGSKAHGRKAAHAAVSARPRGMDDARANEIQTALVKAGYLQSASGHWDSESTEAMRKLQSDNGWQTKLIPDSRALIKLGLGPGAGAAEGGNNAAVTSNLIGPPAAASTE